MIEIAFNFSRDELVDVIDRLEAAAKTHDVPIQSREWQALSALETAQVHVLLDYISDNCKTVKIDDAHCKFVQCYLELISLPYDSKISAVSEKISQLVCAQPTKIEQKNFRKLAHFALHKLDELHKMFEQMKLISLESFETVTPQLFEQIGTFGSYNKLIHSDAEYTQKIVRQLTDTILRANYKIVQNVRVLYQHAQRSPLMAQINRIISDKIAGFEPIPNNFATLYKVIAAQAQCVADPPLNLDFTYGESAPADGAADSPDVNTVRIDVINGMREKIAECNDDIARDCIKMIDSVWHPDHESNTIPQETLDEICKKIGYYVKTALQNALLFSLRTAPQTRLLLY